MKLGELLIAAKLVSQEQVDAALAQHLINGQRLGENLIAAGAISGEVLDAFMHRVPLEPGDLAETGIDEKWLLGLMLKLIYLGQLESPAQIVEAIRLPPHLVSDLIRMASERRLLRAMGSRDPRSGYGTGYALNEEGIRWAQEALEQSQYAGPAPVSLEAFVELVQLQKINHVVVTPEKIRTAFGNLAIDAVFIEKIGPALNSDRAILMYGPPGNGKTSVAFCLADIFNDIIYVPHAVMIGGQIMRVYDPSVHQRLDLGQTTQSSTPSLIRLEEIDTRWVSCRRPFVVTGGELTLEMLDLSFDPTANLYEAPLHVKALGGCFVIDDFGRQLVPPTSLLNRWIVPMESRVDYLKLHTGKSFAIPFEELVIFSTNLEPEDLMDPAYLRRIPYKLEVGAPTRERFRQICERACAKEGLELTDETFEAITHRITQGKGMDLAAYMAKFIVDQVVATCRFLDVPPHFEPRFIDYAVDNLRVNRA